MRAFEDTADYVQNYVQGGRILIKHQAAAMRLAEMATQDRGGAGHAAGTRRARWMTMRRKPRRCATW